MIRVIEFIQKCLKALHLRRAKKENVFLLLLRLVLVAGKLTTETIYSGKHFNLCGQYQKHDEDGHDDRESTVDSVGVHISKANSCNCDHHEVDVLNNRIYLLHHIQDTRVDNYDSHHCHYRSVGQPKHSKSNLSYLPSIIAAILYQACNTVGIAVHAVSKDICNL